MEIKRRAEQSRKLKQRLHFDWWDKYISIEVKSTLESRWWVSEVWSLNVAAKTRINAVVMGLVET